MSLRAGKVNVLNVLNLRRVLHPPQHFFYTNIEKYHPTVLKNIDKWIFSNLNNRYYIGQSIDLINNQLQYIIKLGFEQEKELSYFKIACTIDYSR